MYFEGAVLELALLVLVWLATAANVAPTLQNLPNTSAMMFFPPGASSCGEFLRLEPMQKCDTEGMPLGDGDAENYFAYPSIEDGSGASSVPSHVGLKETYSLYMCQTDGGSAGHRYSPEGKKSRVSVAALER
jgi:hypothetical protein